MKRINIHLTDKQIAKLKKQSVESGLSVAEFIRRLVDMFFDAEGR